jgi:hypothetical protein
VRNLRYVIHHAAIDTQRLAIHPTGIGSDKKRDDIGHVLGLSQTLHSKLHLRREVQGYHGCRPGFSTRLSLMIRRFDSRAIYI